MLITSWVPMPLSVQFSGSPNNDKSKCQSSPPSRPETPTPPSLFDSLDSLVIRADKWGKEAETHEDKAENHLLNSLTCGDQEEEERWERHRAYSGKCRTWEEQFKTVFQKKAHVPSVSSRLNPFATRSKDY